MENAGQDDSSTWQTFQKRQQSLQKSIVLEHAKIYVSKQVCKMVA